MDEVEDSLCTFDKISQTKLSDEFYLWFTECSRYKESMAGCSHKHEIDASTGVDKLACSGWPADRPIQARCVMIHK